MTLSVAECGDGAPGAHVPHHPHVPRGPARALLQPRRQRGAAHGPGLHHAGETHLQVLRRTASAGVGGRGGREHAVH
jgi:hypothetical protein